MGTFSGKGWEESMRLTIPPIINIRAISRRTPIILEFADSGSLVIMASGSDLGRGLIV
jgi:hypothetical protein